MPSAEAKAVHSSLADRYRVLLDISRTLTGTLSRDDLYRAIYRETARVLEAMGFYISVYSQLRDLATIVFYADRGRERRVEISYRGSDSEVIRTGQGTLVEDRTEITSLMVVGNEESDVTRSAISAPLRHKGQVLGVTSARRATAPGPTRSRTSSCFRESPTSPSWCSRTHGRSSCWNARDGRRSRSRRSGVRSPPRSIHRKSSTRSSIPSWR